MWSPARNPFSTFCSTGPAHHCTIPATAGASVRRPPTHTTPVLYIAVRDPHPRRTDGHGHSATCALSSSRRTRTTTLPRYCLPTATLSRGPSQLLTSIHRIMPSSSSLSHRLHGQTHMPLASRPTSMSAARMASPASGAMSGVRPGFSSPSCATRERTSWVRAASTHPFQT